MGVEGHLGLEELLGVLIEKLLGGVLVEKGRLVELRNLDGHIINYKLGAHLKI